MARMDRTQKVSHMPAVSIMLCTNVWDDFSERALLSIEEQSFSDFELIIVANGMDDETFNQLVARASCDPRNRIFRTSMAGVTFSRNLALHYCRAPLLAIMDADDIAYRDRLLVQVDFFERNPAVSVCGSSCDVIDVDDNKLKTCVFPRSDQDIRKALFWRNPLCHPATMMRTACVRDVGGYSGNSAEDYELWIRLSEEANVRFANLHESLLGYRIPVVSVARRSKRAYVHVAGAQFRAFALTKQPLWLVAALISLVKAWFRATQR